FGNMVGREPHFRVGWERHFLNEFIVLAGNSALGAKGMSLSPALELAFRIDPDGWHKRCQKSGLASGEGLIEAVQDPNGNNPGVDDKRLFLTETEFGKPLTLMSREGNILSAVIRQAFETGDLSTLTRKQNRLQATGAHISLVGHITKEELNKKLTEN